MTNGWSKKNILASLFQLYGFQRVPLDDELVISILHGPGSGDHQKRAYCLSGVENEPSSIKRPMAEEQPGPKIEATCSIQGAPACSELN